MAFLWSKDFDYIDSSGMNETNIKEKHISYRPNNHSNYPKNDAIRFN
jgi:hypothetical protein